MIRVAVVGVGHLGKIHLRCLQELGDKVRLVGFYDPDDANAARVLSQNPELHRFTDAVELLASVDAIDIVCPTSLHASWAEQGLAAGKHLFIEKPLTDTAEQAHRLRDLYAQRPELKIQIGHVERFNPAVLALSGQKLQPKFVEAHRLSMFNPRGTDVSVVSDLMIHDLDMLLQWVRSPVRSIHANGVALVSSSPDIATARIEFESGTVANLTASRISLKAMRKFRVFQPDAYISLDLLNKKTEIVRLFEQEADGRMELDTAKGKRYIEVAMPQIPEVNAIRTELDEWLKAIRENLPTPVPLSDGVRVVELAEEINRVMVCG